MCTEIYTFNQIYIYRIYKGTPTAKRIALEVPTPMMPMSCQALEARIEELKAGQPCGVLQRGCDIMELD